MEMTADIPTAGNVLNLIFHLFTVFLMAYSGLAVFALLRFGQSRLIGTLTTALYIGLLSSLYFQTLSIINQL